MKELKHKQERYTKNIVKLRSEAINKCHETLRNAKRSNNARLIQLGCLTQWNLCLPLLQPGLRSNVRKPLQFVSECLEDIDSMEWLFRCQIHLELAKCDEEIEQLQTAEQHFLKAIHFDDESVYKEQLNHGLHRLRLRGELYKTPERIEDKVSMILEQCVVGGGKSAEKKLRPAVQELMQSFSSDAIPGSQKGEINTHSLLLRAADLLAPTQFTRVMESETYKLSYGKINDDQVSRMHKKMVNFENCIKKCENHLSERFADLEREYNRSSQLKMHDGNSSSRLNETQRSTTSSLVVPTEKIETILVRDYKERLKLWLDLSRIARKQKIWDICRVSARFCLLYDNEEAINRFLKASPPTTAASQRKHESLPVEFKSLFDRELMRNLAEIHFIFGEVDIL